MPSRSLKSTRGPTGYQPLAKMMAPTGIRPGQTSVLPSKLPMALPNTLAPLPNTAQPLQPGHNQALNLRGSLPGRQFRRG